MYVIMDNELMNNFGVRYLIVGDYDNAIKEFEKEGGISYLGFMHFYGIGTKVDYAKAWEEVHYIRQDSYTGDDIWDIRMYNILSKFIAGKMLYNGIYVEKDIKKGLWLFKSIADDWKIEETIANTYAFKMLIEDFEDRDAQYLFGLLDFYRGKYKEYR